MSADPLTLTLLAMVVALARRIPGGVEAVRGTLGSLTAGLEGSGFEGLEVGPSAAATQLIWEQRQLTVTPAKIFDANPSPRRRVVIWNSSVSTIRLAETQQKVQAGAGGRLLSNGIIIDEPPNPHGGEWWAVADGTATIDVAQLS